MPLPLKLPWELAQTKWKSQLEPVISAPMTGVVVLEKIVLKTGINVINHKLGQMQQGWFTTDINAPITLYRSAPFNDLTLTLTASAPAIVNLGVY